MISLPLSWLSEVLNNSPQNTPNGGFTGICTDTRQPVAGAVFLALQGENSDGHRFLKTAEEKGAVGAVVVERNAELTIPQWVVPDTLLALGEIAREYRRRFRLPVIGVTGSVGKTSTKEMIGAMLGAVSPTLVSPKNYNNEIGVPQSLLQLTPEHRVAVLEMGMRGMGQIEYLARIAQPTIGLITQIGVAHIELIGSQEGIALAKSELLTQLPPDGSAVLPITSPYADLLEERTPQGTHIIWYGVTDDKNANVRALPDSIRFDEGGKPSFNVVIDGADYSVLLNAVGAHNVHNATAALAVAFALVLDYEEAIAALQLWEGAEGRMTVRQSPLGYRVLDDCYNAAPESMTAALATLDRLAWRGRLLTRSGVAILGDMRELGAFAEEAHKQVGRAVQESQIRLLVTVGALAEGIAEEARRSEKPLPAFAHFPNSEACAAGILTLLNEEETILVKGSRAMEMESIVSVLMGKGSEG